MSDFWAFLVLVVQLIFGGIEERVTVREEAEAFGPPPRMTQEQVQKASDRILEKLKAEHPELFPTLSP